MTEDQMWFWAVLLFTVPPVLRFRENALVPGLAMLLTFGFYCVAYWMPDFYDGGDWPRIIGTNALILLFYFISGFVVHYLWFSGKSDDLSEHGAFGPLLKAWISGKTFVANESFVAEIRRLRMFEVKWANIKTVERDGDHLIISDGIEREPEILSEIKIAKTAAEYDLIFNELKSRGKI